MELSKENLSKLQAVVDGLCLDDAVTLYNAVCYECNYLDHLIYRIDELDDLLCDLTPSEIVRLVSYGDFNYDYKYFTYDGLGNLKSIRRAHDLVIDLDDVVHDLVIDLDDVVHDLVIALDDVVHVYEKDPSQLPDPVKDFLNELEEESESESESEEMSKEEAEERAYLRRCHAIATCSNQVAYGIALEQARKEMREWQTSKGYI